jgi:hypothetical protein
MTLSRRREHGAYLGNLVFSEVRKGRATVNYSLENSDSLKCKAALQRAALELGKHGRDPPDAGHRNAFPQSNRWLEETVRVCRRSE